MRNIVELFKDMLNSTKEKENINNQIYTVTDEAIKAASITKPLYKAYEDGFKLDNKHMFAVNNEPDQEDLINKPNHYHLGGYDIYEILQMKYGKEVYQGFCIGNILKYTFRHEHKGKVDDLKKAKFNMDRLIESYEGKEYIPEYKQKKNERDDPDY